MAENEISRKCSLFDDLGRPVNFGWARHAYLDYNPENAYAPIHRLSESDRYILHSPTHLAVFEISDNGWLGLMGISVVSLRDKKRTTQAFDTIFPLGTYDMPNSKNTGSVRWRRKKNHLDFISMESGARIVKAELPKFDHNRSLRCAVVLSETKGSESIMTSQPWHNDKYAFRYSCCTPCLNAEGVIQFGSTEIAFTKGHAWGILDWNRCARPKADIRYWASACGQSEGRQMGFCVGYSWADSSLGTENGFFIDGKLHKLDQVTFHIPLSNWLSPWRFTSNDNRLEMTFIPHQWRLDRRSFLLHYSTRRQVFGFFSGKVHLDNDQVIEFQNLTGFAERSKLRF